MTEVNNCVSCEIKLMKGSLEIEGKTAVPESKVWERHLYEKSEAFFYGIAMGGEKV